MIKIYLNDVGSLVIKNSDVDKIYPAGNYSARYGYDNNTFGIKYALAPTYIADIKKENGDDYADLAELEAVLRDFFSKARLQHTGISILNAASLSIPDADTWTKINALWDVHTDPKGFEMDLINSALVHTGFNNTTYNFTGTSDVKSSKNATVEYALVKNGDVDNPIATSRHTFGNANSIESMDVTKAFNLKTGDTLNLFARSDVASNVLTIYSLDTTFWGDR